MALEDGKEAHVEHQLAARLAVAKDVDGEVFLLGVIAEAFKEKGGDAEPLVLANAVVVGDTKGQASVEVGDGDALGITPLGVGVLARRLGAGQLARLLVEKTTQGSGVPLNFSGFLKPWARCAVTASTPMASSMGAPPSIMILATSMV